jgi:hypothetical protein
VPYLPVFVLTFLPLPLLDFTTSYLAWTVINLIGLLLYLQRFARATGGKLGLLRLLQWAICIPVIANMFLGQANLLLLIFVGEGLLAYRHDKRMLSGIWLAGLLLKPQVLILLLPGLLLGKQWRLVSGFAIGSLVAVGASLILVGPAGLAANWDLIYQFTGPLIQTVGGMVNWRALALNLTAALPGWIAWGVAFAGMSAASLVVLWFWFQHPNPTSSRFVLLMLATYASALTVTWHAHFYLMMPLVLFLIYLDQNGELPEIVRAVWLLAPFCIFGLAAVVWPELTRSLFGTGMLVLNLFLTTWALANFVKAVPQHGI